MSPSTAFGVGTVFDAGQVVDERRGEERLGRVFLDLLRVLLVDRNLRIAHERLRRRHRRRGGLACCAASGDCRHAPATSSASATDFFMETSQNSPYAISRGVSLMRRNPHRAALLLRGPTSASALALGGLKPDTTDVACPRSAVGRRSRGDAPRHRREARQLRRRRQGDLGLRRGRLPGAEEQRAAAAAAEGRRLPGDGRRRRHSDRVRRDVRLRQAGHRHRRRVRRAAGIVAGSADRQRITRSKRARRATAAATTCSAPARSRRRSR